MNEKTIAAPSTEEIQAQLRQCQHRLHSGEKRFHNLVTRLADGVIIVDTEGVVRFVNPAAETMFGSADNVQPGHPFGVPIVVGETTEIDLVRSDPSPHSPNAYLSHGVGEMRVVEIEWEGSRASLISIRDVTEHKQSQEALEQANDALEVTNVRLVQAARFKDDFIASMSHELRTPLNVILGLAGALQEETYGPLTEHQHHLLQNIEHNGQVLLAIINDILEFARIEAGQTTLDLHPTSIPMVCQTSLGQVRKDIQARGLTLAETIDPDAPHVHADPQRLKQVLVHLLRNAIKFTPSGGHIGLEVTSDRTRRVVRVTVWDTGIGIAPELQERLFQPLCSSTAVTAAAMEAPAWGWRWWPAW
ncbi:MAG: PAS domain S-box protein [Chloroflexaceae bacterium]|nr:PAS domain S-box protein [Chloroflexaceae bacterium]